MPRANYPKLETFEEGEARLKAQYEAGRAALKLTIDERAADAAKLAPITAQIMKLDLGTWSSIAILLQDGKPVAVVNRATTVTKNAKSGDALPDCPDFDINGKTYPTWAAAARGE